jgi:ubiquitin-protein ligase E3 C
MSGQELLGRHHAKIRRDQVFEDAYSQFYGLGESLKEPIQITFVDQFDTVEAGIDGGGVTKEFLTSVTNEAFRAEDGPNLFVANDQNLLYPSPSALDERHELLRQFGIKEGSAEWHENIKELLRRYEFLGRIVGKCLYEGILVDIGFAGFFLRKWAASGAAGTGSGYRANINDLRDLDESLYQGILKLKNYPGNVEDFSLDFTITDTVSLPGAATKTITRELVSGGADIPVTNENRPLYVFHVARHRLTKQPWQQTQAFLKGLGEIINPKWLSMFNQSELQTLIGGDASEIDVEDLRRNTQYGGVYQIGDDGLEHPTVRLFWKVFKELDDADRRKVLKYVTSTPRAPLLGFSQLNPRFSIRDAGSDQERLPSTSTCVNLLKLPRYSTATTLRQKLLYAVNSGAGFDLS